MNYQEILTQAENDLGIPSGRIEKIYKSYWRGIRELIQDIPIKETMSVEEFEKLRPNFNIPSLGKLCCTPARFIGMKKRFKFVENLKKEKENETEKH